MDDNATKVETVVIPGELRLSNPVPPPVTVALPITARPHGLWNVLAGLLALPIGLVCGPAFLVLALTAPTADLSLGSFFIFLVVMPVLLFGSVFLPAALTCFRDAARRGIVLEITADGLRDYRSGLSVSWASVRRAKILYGGAPAVDLTLDRPVTNWQNPFRIGVLFNRFRPKPDHVIVSIACLSVRVHILAYSILTLTQWNGGEAISTSPGAMDMGLKVLPREPRPAAATAHLKSDRLP